MTAQRDPPARAESPAPPRGGAAAPLSRHFHFPLSSFLGSLSCPVDEVGAASAGALGVGGAAEALAGDLDEVGVMAQPIQRRVGQEGLVEERGPLLEGAVGRDDDRAPFVPLRDDLVEILGGRRPDRRQAEVIEYEQVNSHDGRHAALVAAIGSAAVEPGQQLGCVCHQHVVAKAACLVGEGLGQVALAHASLSQQQDVLAGLDELAGGQVKDLLLVEPWVEAPVEVLQRLGDIEVASTKAQGQLLLFAAFGLVLPIFNSAPKNMLY